MASPQGSQHIASKMSILSYTHDPDTTSAAVVTPDGGTTERWVDMNDFTYFGANAVLSVAAGNGITKLEIVGNTASDGTGTTVVIKDSGTIQADAVGDNAFQECTAEEVRQEGLDNSVDLRYVAARLTVQNAGDEAVVTYIRSGARHQYRNLTPATTLA